MRQQCWWRMNRLLFFLAGCCMACGDVVFLVAFGLDSWVEQQVTFGGFADGLEVNYGLWRTCSHNYITERAACDGIRLSQAATGLACIALIALLGSAALYVILWFKLHKLFVLGIIFLHLLAAVMCTITLSLVSIRQQDLASSKEGTASVLGLATALAAAATTVTFYTTGIICAAIFIREPFPPNPEEQPPPQPPPEANNRRLRPRINLDQTNFNSSRNSMISDSQTEFSSSSFGSTSVLPSGETGVDTISQITGSSLRGAVGMSVSDFDIRARGAVNLAAEFSDDSLDRSIRDEEIELQSLESMGGASSSNLRSRVSRNQNVDSLFPPASRRPRARTDDVYTGSAASRPRASRRVDESSEDECTVDRVIQEDIMSRDFTRSDLNLIQYGSDVMGRTTNGSSDI